MRLNVCPNKLRYHYRASQSCNIPSCFQVFALTARILSESDPTLRKNVIAKNSSGLSSLDYTTVTNNLRIGVFLAELFFILGQDILCKDAAGNTIVIFRAFMSFKIFQSSNHRHQDGKCFTLIMFECLTCNQCGQIGQYFGLWATF